MRHRTSLVGVGAGLVAAVAVAVGLTAASADSPSQVSTATPIKHVVVLFDENISFDHYFGTYPNATNPDGEPQFTATRNTPSPNNLSPQLRTNNPNAANPNRLDPKTLNQVVTCDMGHAYTPEQKAFDGGLMDKFVENTSGSNCAAGVTPMSYYDGNTVTGLWNYAQHYAMNDNSYNTQFGPSSPGAMNLIAGQTYGVTDASGQPLASKSGSVANFTAYGDGDAAYDDCGSKAFGMSGKNVGDLLNDKGVTWGWFQGGFKPTTATPTAACATAHTNVAGASSTDYSSHHNPFAYYQSTSNPHHLRPTSTATIGQTDQANHEYDLSDFHDALAAGNMPSVSFLKAPEYQDGHAGYSDPIDEQKFLVDEINRIEASPEWDSTAIVIAYDDSDGWYDHQMSQITRPSAATEDALSGTAKCGNLKAGNAAPGENADQCGFGPRLPLLVVSPYAKPNFVDSTETDQSSVLRFIEDNWSLGRIPDVTAGGVTHHSADATAGSLLNMFDFSASAQRAPSLQLSDATGVVTSMDPAPSGPVTGLAGPAGTAGTDGTNGTNGTNGMSGANGSDGAAGVNGANGVAGPAGPKGDTGPQGPAGTVGKITCTGTLKGKKVSVSCHTAAPAKKRTNVRVRLVSSGRVLATSRSLSLTGRRSVSTTLTARRALRHGHYTLRLSIDQAGKVTGEQSTLRV